MPEIFTIGQLREVRVREGQSPDSKALLTRYCRNGRIERIGRGLYRKKSFIVSETFNSDPNSESEASQSAVSGGENSLTQELKTKEDDNPD